MSILNQDYKLYKNSGYDSLVETFKKEQKELNARQHIFAVLSLVEEFENLLKNGAFLKNMHTIQIRPVHYQEEEGITFQLKDNEGKPVYLTYDNGKPSPLYERLHDIMKKITHVPLMNESFFKGNEFPLNLSMLPDLQNALLNSELQIMLEQMLLNNRVDFVAPLVFDNETPINKPKVKI